VKNTLPQPKNVDRSWRDSYHDEVMIADAAVSGAELEECEVL
jgi:hypothetical protein